MAKVRVLVVEDEESIQALIRFTLEQAGFGVESALSAEEARTLLAQELPDVVLLDWNMPVMTGIEFLVQLRQRPGGDQPKVVFCTTNSDNGDIRKGIEAGADEYVIKPFDHHTLHRKLQGIGAA